MKPGSSRSSQRSIAALMGSDIVYLMPFGGRALYTACFNLTFFIGGLGQCYWRLSTLEERLLDYDLTGQPGGNGQINVHSCSN